MCDYRCLFKNIFFTSATGQIAFVFLKRNVFKLFYDCKTVEITDPSPNMKQPPVNAIKYLHLLPMPLKSLSGFKLQLALSLTLTWVCFLNFFVSFFGIPSVFLHLLFLYFQSIGIRAILRASGFRNTLYYKLSYLGIILYQLGFMFKVQHWYYAGPLLLSAYLFLLILYTWRFIRKRKKEVLDYAKWIWLIVVILQDYLWMQHLPGLVPSFLSAALFSGLMMASWNADRGTDLDEEINSIGADSF